MNLEEVTELFDDMSPVIDELFEQLPDIDVLMAAIKIRGMQSIFKEIREDSLSSLPREEQSLVVGRALPMLAKLKQIEERVNEDAVDLGDGMGMIIPGIKDIKDIKGALFDDNPELS